MPQKRTSAFNRALQEAQGGTVTPQDSYTVSPFHSTISSEAVKPQNGNTVSSSEAVKPQNGNTASQYIKVTFYLTQEQVEKLEDLEHDHRKRTRKRINRNDIVRHLIDRCAADDLADLEAK